MARLSWLGQFASLLLAALFWLALAPRAADAADAAAPAGAALAASAPQRPAGTLHIGSKRFTESYILGELLTQTAAPHARSEHLQGLGNTAIVLAALRAGKIDVYPEYLGTIDLEILKHQGDTSLEQIRRELLPLGLGVAVPLGFNNTYALAMRADADVRTLSELAARPALRFGLSHEFIGRADGWPGLVRRYGLHQHPSGLDHGIAYEALARRQVDVIDIYSTDAKIRQYGLRVLDDDRHHFPRYDAVLLYRLDAAARFPAAWHALLQLEGRIGVADMIGMNAAAEIDGQGFAAIARDWLAAHPAAAASASASAPQAATIAAAPRAGLLAKLFDRDLWPLTRQHLTLVVLAVLLACAVGVPLGVLAAYRPRLRQAVLALVGVLQTVPSLALLALLIPLLGMIGTAPALVALFVYALLPVVRNTCTGLLQVPSGLRLAAMALGLRPRDRLLRIELPLALPVILAGVKTAAVMSVGTATIAAFIGAGGYGERITIGLALNDNDMLLAGAIPAALLALLTQGAFELAERLLGRAPSGRA
ncbi:glycine betaine ABC transporter substrate-binding protein [Rugamonas sp. CCM 8940]|uniref:glycine betaine ABC transporter substrate-binding protein n=1 Tax=Rugamonas sp. CCM 8940 TaxID=2765359 RepID=UPI0018F4982C|nr:glycine betaine ABC transporter substrate-binding protein [Rugamonas sp. CCM 8940]MBJ7308944.1 ABC transporter permease subunit [Rugamonas sp. CCM 8940]